MTVSIKISEENYRRLSALSGRLRQMFERPVSLNEAITYLYARRKLSDMAGAWVMSDREAEDVMKDLKKGWKSWNKKSA